MWSVFPRWKIQSISIIFKSKFEVCRPCKKLWPNSNWEIIYVPTGKPRNSTLKLFISWVHIINIIHIKYTFTQSYQVKEHGKHYVPIKILHENMCVSYIVNLFNQILLNYLMVKKYKNITIVNIKRSLLNFFTAPTLLEAAATPN